MGQLDIEGKIATLLKELEKETGRIVEDIQVESIDVSTFENPNRYKKNIRIITEPTIQPGECWE